MDQRLSGGKDGANADFIPFPPEPVTVEKMQVILAPFRQQLNNLASTVTASVAVYDPATHKAGTITSALYNLTRTIGSLKTKIDGAQFLIEDSTVEQDIDDVKRKLRHIQETQADQTERFHELESKLDLITKTLMAISEDIVTIKHSGKRERELVFPQISPYGWPIGYNPLVQQSRDVHHDVRSDRDYRDDHDDRDYSRKQSRK